MDRVRLLRLQRRARPARLPRSGRDGGDAGLGRRRAARPPPDRRDRLGSRNGCPPTEVPDAKLRPLLAVLPVPPLQAELRRLIEWTADYYCASLASVARMVLASGGALRGPATMTEYRLTGGMPERMTPQRAGGDRGARRRAGDDPRAGRDRRGQRRRAARAGQPGRARAGRRSIATGPTRARSADFAQPELTADQQEAAERLVDVSAARRLRAVPARRRDRLGQDRDLLRSHRAEPRGRASKRLSCCPKSR